MEKQKATLQVTSTAFEHNGTIPTKYTCEGSEINPPLEIDQIPDKTKSLALIVEDPDAPGGVFDHWLVWNIPPQNMIKENSNPGISGANSGGKTGYHGPCPPKGSHRYFFHVFALDTELELMAGSGKDELKEAMKAHILASGVLMGTYERAGKKAKAL